MITPSDVFEDLILGWGNKFSDAKLVDVWEHDRQYLLWAANLTKKPCDRPPPSDIVARIRIANLYSLGKTDEAEQLFQDFRRWEALALRGEGLEELHRPTREECLQTLSACTVLAGHSDLDGIYSLAIAIAKGGALESGKMKGAFSRVRLLRYGFRSLDEYTQHLAFDQNDTLVIIDFAAHPKAALTLDHHVTALQHWALGDPPPVGVFEASMPSCPRLLATFCGISVGEDILCGCDLIDGALYESVEQAHDLTNPFVALEGALSLDVGDSVGKKVVFLLAENALRPEAVLEVPSFRARVELLKCEMEEQRSFWRKGGRIRAADDYTAVADARLAPYSGARFRYTPFEFEECRDRPFLITIRPSGAQRVNLGVARNPFYRHSEFFRRAAVNLGALCRSLGKGGGRQEAAAVTIEADVLPTTIETIVSSISASSSGATK